MAHNQATTQTREIMGATEYVQVGPWGGCGGNNAYEFKPTGRIMKIIVRSGSCIDSIKFVYYCSCSNGERESPRYGGEGGSCSQQMCIDSGEEIIELSGTVGTYNGYMVITSLCFKTDKKSSTFGSPNGEKFSLPVKANTTKFAGFHGKSGCYLDSIGAILVPK